MRDANRKAMFARLSVRGKLKFIELAEKKVGDRIHIKDDLHDIDDYLYIYEREKLKDGDKLFMVRTKEGKGRAYTAFELSLDE